MMQLTLLCKVLALCSAVILGEMSSTTQIHIGLVTKGMVSLWLSSNL